MNRFFTKPETLLRLRRGPLADYLNSYADWLSDQGFCRGAARLHLVQIADFSHWLDKQGLIIPSIITIYADRSFTFELKTPPAAVLLKRAAKIAKGSGEPNKAKVGTVTVDQLREIAEMKAPDLNAHDVEAAIPIIAGTARSMGIEVEEA